MAEEAEHQYFMAIANKGNKDENAVGLGSTNAVV